jgi:serine/threonine protein kinase
MVLEVISLIAKGSFGQCYKVKKDDKILCQKKIDLCSPKVDNEDIKNELSFLGRIEHLNIIKLHSYELGKDMMLSFFTELCYCSLENLRTIYDKKEFMRNRISIKTGCAVGYQILNALKYIHNLNPKIVHLDLKDTNVLITENGVVKLIDFGLAMELNSDNLVVDNVSRGTYEYQAPEVREKDIYGTPADIWSFGVLMYELFFGVIVKPERESYDRRNSDVFKLMQLQDNIKDSFNYLFGSIFQIEPSKRPDVSKLLKYKYFTFKQNEAQEKIVEEIKLLENLLEMRKKFTQQIIEAGSLPILNVEDSSDESSSDEDSETDSEDDEDEK